MLKDFSGIYNREDITINSNDAMESINRTILTNNPLKNKQIWESAGYLGIPSIKEIIEEMRHYGH